MLISYISQKIIFWLVKDRCIGRSYKEFEHFIEKIWIDSLINCNVFYYDAGSPYQKGAIEVNHELVRRILPKGTSFDHLTQEDIFLMMNHINSYKRKKLNDRSPYETFSFYHGEDVLEKLACRQVAAKDIMLKPGLLKK